VLDLSNSELQRQKINIEINVPEVVYANVYPQEVLQVLLNILNNAIISLASLEHEGKKISISLSENNDQVLICIEDNGPGVPKGLEKKLFDLLANVKGAGMGLGLWLCKYVIARHEGKIWYEQAEQGGAKFCIKFPANLVSYKIRS
jgi:signal transduction histidine kinase